MRGMGEGEWGLFGFIANGSREQERKGGERETPWEDDPEPFGTLLAREEQEEGLLSPGISPSSPGDNPWLLWRLELLGAR